MAPTYIDCRRADLPTAHPVHPMDFLTATVLREAACEASTMFAGGETAGIPFAALVAERMALPETSADKKPKGLRPGNARIEGAMSEGASVFLCSGRGT